MNDIAHNLAHVRDKISAAATRCGRSSEEVTLLAVSKTKPASAIEEAVAAGQTAFGENYVQEGLEKATQLSANNLEWHFIGALQSNKAGRIAEVFSWVHSIDRLKIAEKLNVCRPHQLPPLNVCLQVNVSGEASKSGMSFDEVARVAEQVKRLPNLKLRGLMCIPAPTDDVSEQRHAFSKLRHLYEDLNRQGFSLDTLSMGMSHDLEAAVAEGATIVRVGTAIFGERNKK